MTSEKRKQISATMQDLIAERGEKTICPSEVARAVFSDEEWREQMDAVREVAQTLIERGVIEATQKGKVIKSAVDAHGPIRLRKRRKS